MFPLQQCAANNAQTRSDYDCLLVGCHSVGGTTTQNQTAQTAAVTAAKLTAGAKHWRQKKASQWSCMKANEGRMLGASWRYIRPPKISERSLPETNPKNISRNRPILTDGVPISQQAWQ